MAGINLRIETQDRVDVELVNLRRAIALLNAEVLENNRLVRIGSREALQHLEISKETLRLRREALSVERESRDVLVSDIGEQARPFSDGVQGASAVFETRDISVDIDQIRDYEAQLSGVLRLETVLGSGIDSSTFDFEDVSLSDLSLDFGSTERMLRDLISVFGEVGRIVALTIDEFRGFDRLVANLFSGVGAQAGNAFVGILETTAEKLNDLFGAFEETGTAQRRQIELQQDVEDALLRTQEVSGGKREAIQKRRIDISTEYRSTKRRTEREITAIESEETQKRDQIAELSRTERIANQEVVRRSEQQHLLVLSEQYRSFIEEIATQRDRVRFTRLFEEGTGAEESLRNTREVFTLLDVNRNVASNLAMGFGVLTDTLNVAFSQGLSGAMRFFDFIVRQQATVSDLELALRIEPREVEPVSAEATTVGTLLEAGDSDFNRRITALRGEQLGDELRLIEENLNARYRLYQRVYTRIGSTITGILTGRYASISDVARRFLSELLSFIIQQEIAQRLSDAREIALNTAKANAKIANERRTQAEILRTAFFARQAETAIGAAGLGILGPLGIIAGVIGLGALAVSAISGVNRSNQVPGASNVDRNFDRPAQLHFNFDDGTVRTLEGRVNSSARENRL